MLEEHEWNKENTCSDREEEKTEHFFKNIIYATNVLYIFTCCFIILLYKFVLYIRCRCL